MSLSTLRPVSHTSLVWLTDDSLLIILGHLSLPELLEFISASRKVHQLIVQYILPQYRTLLYGYSWEGMGPSGEPIVGPGNVQLYFSKHLHPFTDFCKREGLNPDYDYFLHPAFNRRPRRLHQSLLASLPVSLPNILPRIGSLTFSLFLNNSFLLTNEQIAVNRLYTCYLTSTWATNLVSLHLFIEVINTPVGNAFSLLLINDLPALRHLFLDFTKSANVPLPFAPAETMPILGQLTSFSMHRYQCPNPVTLLQQLGPKLAFLSLFELSCTVDDFGFFLQSNPPFRETLEELEVDLPYENNNMQIFTVVSQYLPSLKRLLSDTPILDNPFPIFEDLNQLINLREVNFISLLTTQLRMLQNSYPRDALPRLLSIRTASLKIDDDDQENFKASDLFDEFLPLLAGIFCALKRVHITYIRGTNDANLSPALSQALTTQAKINFKAATTCICQYFC